MNDHSDTSIKQQVRWLSNMGWLLFAIAYGCGTNQPGVAAITPGTSTKTSAAVGTGGSVAKTPDAGTAGGGCTTVDDCPKANMSVVSTAITGTGLLGYVGEPVKWDIAGQDKNSPKRRVGILLNNVPEGAHIAPDKSVETTAKIEWTPASAQRSVKKLEVYLRDLDLCEVTETDKSACTEYTYLEMYDQKQEFDWETKRRDGIDSKANGKGAAKPDSVAVAKPSTTTSTSSGGAGGLLSSLGGLTGGSSGLGSLTGLLGGSGGLGNLGSLTSLLGGSGGLGNLGSLTSLIPGGTTTGGTTKP